MGKQVFVVFKFFNFISNYYKKLMSNENIQVREDVSYKYIHT